MNKYWAKKKTMPKCIKKKLRSKTTPKEIKTFEDYFEAYEYVDKLEIKN